MNTSALALGGIAAAAIMFHLAFLSDRALIPLFLVAGLLGATFVSFGYGFTERLRALVSGGAGRALGTAFIIPAIAAPIVLPVCALVEGYARFVAPVGLPLLLGAAVFGIGMQIANGCGSGCLVAAGQGSRRLLVALPFFCAGGVLGSLVLPALLRLPDLGEIDLADRLGVGPGLLATEALLAAGAALLLRGSRPLRADLLAGSVIGALAIVVFLVSGQPWGITTGLTLCGAKAAQGVGIDLSAKAWQRAQSFQL